MKLGTNSFFILFFVLILTAPALTNAQGAAVLRALKATRTASKAAKISKTANRTTRVARTTTNTVSRSTARSASNFATQRKMAEQSTKLKKLEKKYKQTSSAFKKFRQQSKKVRSVKNNTEGALGEEILIESIFLMPLITPQPTPSDAKKHVDIFDKRRQTQKSDGE